MSKKVDRTGRRFGKLIVKDDSGIRKHGFVVWRCLCDCGRETFVASCSLNSGNSKSCGCLIIETARKLARENFTKHGQSDTPTWKCWSSMRERCSNEDNAAYKNYGGRGIKICGRWDDFVNFISDMGVRPYGMTLDRIDVNGDYDPSNCRWATVTDQANNRRSNRIIEFRGESKTISQWATNTNVAYSTFFWRITHGWPMERALGLV